VYTIGQFSLIVGITTKMLRHYDKIGLLRPAKVGWGNAYRYYSKDQADTARTIAKLRRADLPLRDIARYLERMNQGLDTTQVLSEHRNELQKRKDLVDSYLLVCDTLLQKTQKETYMKVHDPIEKVSPSFEYVSVRKMATYDGEHQLFEELAKAKSEKLKNQNGIIMTVYHTPEYSTEPTDIEAIRGVTKDGDATMPQANVVSVVYEGSYDECGNGFKKLFDYIEERGLKVIAPLRMIHLRHPDKTEIPMIEIQAPVG